MMNAQQPEKTPKQQDSQGGSKSSERKDTGVGAAPVGGFGIFVLIVYLVLLSVLLIYGLVQFWPSANSSDSASASVTYLRWTFPVSDEVRLILIVVVTGALGGLVHVLRSLYWYVGNRDLRRSWLAKYILLPFVGSTMGLIFYFVLRGGLFSPEANFEDTSIFGFVAVAGLVGMFSEQAAEKLRQVAATLLTETPEGEDHVPSKKQDSDGKGKP